MTEQRTDEWKQLDARGLEYHDIQWKAPKESTKAFSRFVAVPCSNSSQVTDIACGGGAVTAFLAERHPECRFVGIDLSADLVRMANGLAKQQGFENLSFRVDDWLNLSSNVPTGGGVISTQTLSWLPEMRRPLESIFKRIQPDWIAISSLFYEGDISCTVDVLEHQRGRKSFYNCYSIPEVGRIADANGYSLITFEAFEIGIDLQRNQDLNLMGTRTVRVIDEDGSQRRLQVSGPLLMNWYHILLRRTA